MFLFSVFKFMSGLLRLSLNNQRSWVVTQADPKIDQDHSQMRIDLLEVSNQLKINLVLDLSGSSNRQ